MFSPLDFLNYTSLGLSFVSYAVKERYWLHALAGISLALGIAFMWASGIYSSVFGLGMLLLINIVQFTRYVIDRTEVELGEDDKHLALIAFSQMRSRAFQNFFKAATITAHAKGDVLLEIGGDTHGLHLVCGGRVREVRRNSIETFLTVGMMWGECTLVSGSNYGGSPTKLFAEDDVKIAFWPYELLTKLSNTQPVLFGALMQGAAATIVKKTLLLLPDGKSLQGIGEAQLSPIQRMLHGLFFSFTDTQQLAKISNLGHKLKLSKGDSIPDGVIAIIDGVVKITRSDGHSLTLNAGSFCGEIGMLETPKGKLSVTKEVTADLIAWAWDKQTLAALEHQDAALYASIMRSFAIDVATKLGRPLESSNA